jgi:hypothetical protein
MCTVTFVPATNGCFLTHNRDEKLSRSIGTPPKVYANNGVKIAHPTDPDAKGTWFAINEFGFAACILNGAFYNTKLESNYTISRGLILLQIISNHTPQSIFNNINLSNVAPFTLIITNGSLLYDCRWDGTKKYIKQLTTTKNYIWSSTTLFTEAQHNIRKQWFANFCAKNKNAITQQKILHFHSYTNPGKAADNLIMAIENSHRTFCITNATISQNQAELVFDNLDAQPLHKTLILKTAQLV